MKLLHFFFLLSKAKQKQESEFSAFEEEEKEEFKSFILFTETHIDEIE